MVPDLERLVRPADPSGPDAGLLILLHGLGSDERDMFGFAAPVAARYTVVALRAPLEYEIGGYAWFGLGWSASGISYNADEARASLEVLRSTVLGLQSEFRVESPNLVIGGFSQGAIMSLGLMLTEPDLIGGALLMSGAVVPDIMPENAGARPDARILIQHGLYDQVLPVQLGRGARDLLESRGYRPDYREYPMAHEVSMRSLQDAMDWLSGFDERT